MKAIKNLLLVLFCVFSSVVFSQEHIKFKGIPLNGNVNSFAQELVKIGFKIVKSKGDIILMKGEFINKECEILVVGSTKTNIVWKVIAYLPKETSWYSIKNDYFEVKKQFQQKYGGGESYEYFSKPYYEGDGYEMQALGVDKCTYTTFFKTELGTIAVDISKYERISIGYEDKINLEIKEAEDESVISNDI